MAETEDEALEEARLKILKAQDAANKKNSGDQYKQENFQPHQVNKDETDPLDEKLRVDQIQSQEGRVNTVAPISGTSAVRAVSAKMDPANFADALEQWRYMSEKYRDRRIAKEKDAKKAKPETEPTSPETSLDQEESGSAPIFNETKFQENYENDRIEFSDEKARQKNIERDKIIKKLSEANLEIDPYLIIEPESNDIEPVNGVLTVAEVMTKDVICVIDSMTIEQVASIFNKKKITGVPVVNYKSQMLIGIITMSDIIAHLFEEGLTLSLHEESHSFLPESLSIMEKRVSDLMQKNVIQISAGKSIKDACNLMLENKIHRVLVTQNDRVKGIFTSFDAVRILAKFDIKLFQEINVPIK